MPETKLPSPSDILTDESETSLPSPDSVLGEDVKKKVQESPTPKGVNINTPSVLDGGTSGSGSGELDFQPVETTKQKIKETVLNPNNKVFDKPEAFGGFVESITKNQKLSTKDATELIKYTEKISKLRPYVAQATNQLSEIQKATEDQARAKDAFTKAQENQTTFKGSGFDYEKSINELKNKLSLEDAWLEKVKKKQRDAYSTLGFSQLQAGDNKEAIGSLNQALNTPQGDFSEIGLPTNILYGLGQAHQKEGNDKFAEEYYHKAIADDKLNPDPYRSLAMLAFKQGDKEAAIGYLQSAKIAQNDRAQQQDISEEEQRLKNVDAGDDEIQSVLHRGISQANEVLDKIITLPGRVASQGMEMGVGGIEKLVHATSGQLPEGEAYGAIQALSGMVDMVFGAMTFANPVSMTVFQGATEVAPEELSKLLLSPITELTGVDENSAVWKKELAHLADVPVTLYGLHKATGKVGEISSATKTAIKKFKENKPVTAEETQLVSDFVVQNKELIPEALDKIMAESKAEAKLEMEKEPKVIKESDKIEALKSKQEKLTANIDKIENADVKEIFTNEAKAVGDAIEFERKKEQESKRAELHKSVDDAHAEMGAKNIDDQLVALWEARKSADDVGKELIDENIVELRDKLPAKPEALTDVFHGGDVKDISVANLDNPLYLSETEAQATEYAKGNGGEVRKFKIDKSSLANEQEVRGLINKLGLKSSEVNDGRTDDLNIYELIDPNFETAMNEVDRKKLYSELEKMGYGGIEFLGMNIKSLKNDINDIVIFNPELVLKSKQDALQKQSPSSVLQHPQEGTGKTGGESGRVEPVLEGAKTPEESKTESAEKSLQESLNEKQVDYTDEEIAKAHEIRDKELKGLSTQSSKEQFIHDNIGRIKKEDFEHYADANLIKGSEKALAHNWSKNAKPLDEIAQGLSSSAGFEITPENITNYILDRLNNPDKYKEQKVKEMQEAAEIPFDAAKEIEGYEKMGIDLKTIEAVEASRGFPLSDAQADTIIEHLKNKQNEAKKTDTTANEGAQNPNETTSRSGEVEAEKELSPKEKAKKRIDDARLALGKKLGAGSGLQLQALPEFIELVKAHIDAGIITAKEFLQNTRSDFANRYTDEEIKSAFNRVKDESANVGVTKALISKSRMLAGLSEVESKFESSSKKAEWEKVKKDIEQNPDKPKQIIDAVLTFGSRRPTDILYLNHEQVKMKLQIIDATKKLYKAQESGGVADLLAAESELSSLEAQRDVLHAAIDLFGSEWGQSGAFMQILSSPEFDYVSIKNSIEAEQGFPLTGTQAEKFHDLAKRYSELKIKIDGITEKHREAIKKIKEGQRKDADDKTLQDVKDVVQNNGKKPSLSKSEVIRKRELKNKLFARFNDITSVATLVADKEFYEYSGLLFKEAAGDFRAFSKEIGKNFSKIAKDVVPELWKKLGGTDEQIEKAKTTPFQLDSEFKTLAQEVVDKSDGEFHEGLKSSIDKMVRNRVEADIDTTIDKITDDIFTELRDEIPSLEKDDVRDMISGYGKFKILSKEPVDVALREIKRQGRLDASLQAVTEKGELPLRSGVERDRATQEAREKQAEILRTIKEKGLEPDLSDADIEKQWRSAEEAYHTRLENAIADIEKEIQTGIKKAKAEGREFNDDRSKELRADLERLKEIRDSKTKTTPKTKEEIRLDSAIKSTEKAISEINQGIDNLKKGYTEEGEIYPEKKKPSEKLINARLEELRKLRDSLKEEREKLIPQAIKDKAILEKHRKGKERRKEFLENQIGNKTFDTKKKPELPKLPEGTEDLMAEIKKLERTVWEEKEKIRQANAGDLEKTIEKLSQLQRFSIFASHTGMLRLLGAAASRPAFHPLMEATKWLMSNAPITNRVMKKTITQYNPNIFKGKSFGEYYSKLVAKETFKEAKRELSKGSNWSLEHAAEKGLPDNSMFSKITAVPQKMHGVIKTPPKLAQYYSAYERALQNLHDFGEDITDPKIQQRASKAAEIEALSDVFMQESGISKGMKHTIDAWARSDNAWEQGIGLILKQQLPVIKVPQNFAAELLQKVPLIGILDAIRIVRRSGKKGTSEYGGIENLTDEQAIRAARALTNQFAGLATIGTGMVLYNVYGDDLKKDIVKNKYWFHNTWLQTLMLGIEAEEAVHKGEQEGGEPTNRVTELAVSSGHKIKEGIEELPQMRAVMDIARDFEGEDKLSPKAAKMLSSVLVPQGVRQLAQTLDNEQKRDPKTFAEVMEMNIPGLRDLVPTKEQRRASLLKQNSEKIIKHYNETKDADFLPPAVSKKLTKDGQELELTPKQHKELIEYVSDARDEKLSEYFESDSYTQDLEKGEKKVAEKVKKKYSYAHKEGLKKLIEQYPSIKKFNEGVDEDIIVPVPQE